MNPPPSVRRRIDRIDGNGTAGRLLLADRPDFPCHHRMTASPSNRSGIVLLDKPEGLSSNAALQRVKRAYGARKAGHAGTLDPLATGMLPILLGEATKIAGHLLHKDKAYRVVGRLGESTTTYDAEGEVTRTRPVPALDHDAVRSVLSTFTGVIRQRAPVYSALKSGGRPLYARARRGEAVEAPVRAVRIDRIEIEALTASTLTLHVQCGTGTYIRSLIHDLGEHLGCGAHVTALRRLWVTPFQDQPMRSLAAIEAGPVFPALSPLVALAGWPRLSLNDAELQAIVQGRTIVRVGEQAGAWAGLDAAGRLAALLECDEEGRFRPVRVLNPDD